MPPLNVDITRAAPIPMLKPGLQGPPLSPEMLARMALTNPDLAGRLVSTTGQAPPTGPVAPPLAPPAGPDPNVIGAALAGVQGIQGQAQGAPPPISPQQGGPVGTGAQALLALLGRQRPIAPSLGQLLGG
jgi:hypothetical protein